MTPPEFIEGLMRHFAKRHENEPARIAWLREMAGLVKGTDSRVLDKAYELIRDTHDERAFPLPAVIRKFVILAAEIVYPDRFNVERDEQADWNRKVANAERLMIETELGQQAARDGWANGMREFIVQHGRTPHDHEVGRIIENAIFIDTSASGTVDLGIAHHALVGLAGKLIDRRKAIADRVVNGVLR